MSNNVRRIKVLNNSEIEGLYSLPVFDHSDREDFFSMDKQVKKFVFSLRKFESRVYFILLLGYFRAKPLIYNFSASDINDDLKFVLNKYFNNKKLDSFNLSDKFKIRLMNRLLEHVGFDRYKPGKHKKDLESRLKHTVKISADPRYLFDDCIAFFSQNRIVLPGYTTILDLISQITKREQIRINKIVRSELKSKTKNTVLQMLKSKDRYTDLTQLKKPSSDFSVSEINREIKAHKKISPIFSQLKAVIKKLNLSPVNLEYYASMVRLKSLYHLKRQSDAQTLLYLISYLFFRYQESNDNLSSAFEYLARKLHESSKKYARKKILDDIKVIRKELKAAGDILGMFIDGEIKDEITFGQVRKKAYKVLSKKKIKLLSQHLNETDFDNHHYEWEYIDENITKVTKTLRSIFLTLDLEYEHVSLPLAEQFKITKYELLDNQKIESVNLDIVNKYELKFIEDKENQSERFEYFLYRRAYQLFSRKTITVKDSINNKSLKSDLINSDQWSQNKEEIIKNTNQPKISEPINKTLAVKINSLQSKLNMVCNSIAIGNNKYLEFIPGKEGQLKWSIPYKRWQESIDNPIYKQMPHLGIVELISFVNSKTDFMEGFQHATLTKEKDGALIKDIIACVLGNATNFGLNKMANISDRSIGRLRSVADAYLRTPTLKDANDLISNAIAKLPIFKYYSPNDVDLFSSIDGQKFECRINTLKARFSSKDFFKGKGLSSISLVSNHVAVNAMVIGSNEYEGHYAFDLLYNNTSEIKPNILSTDTHGTNNVNFAILDFYGYQFAPRYAKVKKVFFDLFEVTEDEDNLPSIELKKEINTKLIESEWDAIQHILCSLSEKTASQSTIVRKLSIGKSRTLLALHEYDRLIKANYILDFVDSEELRHYVQQALNRGEAYHQLRRAIASVNGNKFRGGNDYQVSLWNDCARLVANCIIYYNASLLSTFLKMSQEQGMEDMADYIAQLSPVAWQHINLNGEYSFLDDLPNIDFEKMLSGIDLFENN